MGLDARTMEEKAGNGMKRIYIYIIFIWLLMLLWSCNKPEAVSSKPKDQTAVPDQEMWNFDVRMTDKGKLEAHLRSGHMMLFSDEKDPYSILNQGVLVDFYDEDGNHASTLTADSGQYQDKTQNVEAYKNVVIVSDSGVTLHTEAIQYDQEREKIFTDLEVLITTTQGDSFWGDGFESDPHMDNWKINKLNGIAHKGVDMSGESFSKKKEAEQADSLTITGTDSSMTGIVLPDSGMADNED